MIRINSETVKWEVSYDNGESWQELGSASASAGGDGITPKLRINAESNEWEVSYDEGQSWESLGTVAKGERGEDGVSPLVKIENGYWMISYDNGTTWKNTDVKAVGADGKNGTNGTDGKNGENGEDGITPTLRINKSTGMWEVSYDEGRTWTSLGVVAKGETGEAGATPRLRINGITWEVTYNNGDTWTSLGSVGTGSGGADGVTPRLRINPTTSRWEVSYDNGVTWEDLGVANSGSGGGADGVTPQLRINGSTYEWEVSYNNGSTWQSLGVSAKGKDGNDGKDGRGIASMEIIDGYLYVTYTDDPTPVNVGKVSSDTVGGGSVTPPQSNYTDGLAFYPIGDGSEYGVSIGYAKYMSNVVIPATYNGKYVTTILDGAFSDTESFNDTLVSIVIPEGVTTIGANAFAYCMSLTEVVVPSTVVEIGEGAFMEVPLVRFDMTQEEFEARGFSIEALGCHDIEFA